MAGLRTVRTRIRSVHSTQKITKAMKMVAAARLRRSQTAVDQSRPYSKKIEELFASLAPSIPVGFHPLIGNRSINKRALVVFSSDRGLCGSFNSGLFRKVERELKEVPSTSLVLIGKKGTAYFTKRGAEVQKKVDGFWVGFDFAKAASLVSYLVEGYMKNEFDRVDLIYNEFVSVISQKPKVASLLPLEIPTTDGSESSEFIYEPSRDEIVKSLVPKLVEVRCFTACLNSLASEHGARMTAMDSATRNAGDMIDRLTLTMNRARQASITKELMEIIGGAEALK